MMPAYTEKGYAIVTLASGLRKYLRTTIETLAKRSLSRHLTSNSYEYDLFSSCTDEEFSVLCKLPLEERAIPKENVDNMSEQIRAWIGECFHTPDELVNNDIYYRAVSPKIQDKISKVHRDVYFHTILDDWKKCKDLTTVKLWTPIHPESGASLGVIPGSHKDKEFHDVTYIKKEEREVSFECSISRSRLTAVDVHIGDAILFPPELVHGSIGVESIPARRVSIEITLGFR